MKTLYIIDNRTKNVVQVCPVAIDEPYEVIFCKDRKTKQKCVMVRTKGCNPFDISKRQVFQTNFCQYDDVSVQVS
ncbi:MAG: hypothetical protein J6X18_09695 [Bacteroidales bacterium]|nr:hypothetical protein [Bacteroidales bacterium]